MKSILSNNSPRKTYAFGAGREDFEKSCYNSKLYSDKQVPGPGTYTDHTKSVGVNARKHSCHNKLYTLDPIGLEFLRATKGAPSGWLEFLATNQVGMQKSVCRAVSDAVSPPVELSQTYSPVQ